MPEKIDKRTRVGVGAKRIWKERECHAQATHEHHKVELILQFCHRQHPAVPLAVIARLSQDRLQTVSSCNGMQPGAWEKHTNKQHEDLTFECGAFRCGAHATACERPDISHSADGAGFCFRHISRRHPAHPRDDRASGGRQPSDMGSQSSRRDQGGRRTGASGCSRVVVHRRFLSFPSETFLTTDGAPCSPHKFNRLDQARLACFVRADSISLGR